MTRIYELDIMIDYKLVRFSMDVDETLQVVNKVDDRTACKWRTRLQAIANAMFTKESNGKKEQTTV